MKPLGWMMNRKRINESKGEYFLLLFILLALYVMNKNSGFYFPGRIAQEQENVFVKISGDVIRPGIYGFSQAPTLRDIVAKAGGLRSETGTPLFFDRVRYGSGSVIEILKEQKGHRRLRGEMSAFHKITLGIPLSVNKESLDGLTAIRGIGPGIAASIVCERAERGGFKSLEELMSVPGIGRKLYRKVSPYLIL